MSVVVRRVAIVDGAAWPEVLAYRIEFANDWAEGLGMKLSEAIAADAFLPQTALNAPGNVLANLQQLQVVSSTGTALQVDAGMAPPAGGGFEVRRRDGTSGRTWTRTWCCGARCGASRFRARDRWSGTTCGCTMRSTPPVYSRFSSAVFTDLPVS